MPLWIAATLSAALFQTWRTALQQKLRGQLSLNAAAVTRYLYGMPVACVLLALYAGATGAAPPFTGAGGFWAWTIAGGFLQILGTNLLIMSFGPRGFAVGTAYAKTEAVQGAVLALILLGEHLSALSWLGIAIGVGGVLYLSLAGKNLTPMGMLKATGQPAALCGLGAGFCFALCAVCFKAANLQIEHDDPVLRALVVLVCANFSQIIMQGGWLLFREPQQARAVFTTWRFSARVGALSALGSACWFSAFALAPVAMVRALGQVEILLTLAFSRWYLKETPSRSDVVGVLVVVFGVLLVVLGR